MMIEFLNGEREFFVGNNEDCLFQIVREKLGNDAEDLLGICIGDSNDKMNGWKSVAEENERIADGYYGMLNDALHELDEIANYIENSKRISREDLYKKITWCKSQIENNI